MSPICKHKGYHPTVSSPSLRQYAEAGTGLSTSEGTENLLVNTFALDVLVELWTWLIHLLTACVFNQLALVQHLLSSWFWWGCILVSKYLKPLCHEACNTQRLNHGTRSLWLLQVEANLPEAVRRKEEVRIWCVQMPVEFCNVLPPTYSDLQVLLLSYSRLISPVSSVFSNQIDYRHNDSFGSDLQILGKCCRSITRELVLTFAFCTFAGGRYVCRRRRKLAKGKRMRVTWCKVASDVCMYSLRVWSPYVFSNCVVLKLALSTIHLSASHIQHVFFLGIVGQFQLFSDEFGVLICKRLFNVKGIFALNSARDKKNAWLSWEIMGI